MPELPEVETTLRGIAPHLLHQTITQVVVRHYGLRWPIAADIAHQLQGQRIIELRRRGKYLLLHLSKGTLIIHLGMSGRLHILNKGIPAQKHDHVDVEVSHGLLLRFTDPRRFGAFIWTADASEHSLIKHLGVEPHSNDFTGMYLWLRAQNKKLPVKNFVMDQKIVVGVGNIYANEALFLAGIHPLQPAKDIDITHYTKLVDVIKIILNRAIENGGTTLKDFLNSEGKPGYFSQFLHVYGRACKPCTQCEMSLTAIQIGKRNTVFCSVCQPYLHR